MAYIGALPAETYTALTQQTFSSPTGTSFTLSQSCTNSVDIALFIDNVRQDPASYSVSGTSLTTSTIASPSTMYCIFNGRTTETVNPPDDSVGLSQMASATDGNLITFDASGNPAYVATGSDSQVLTSSGAGSPCAFETLTTGKVLQVVNVQSSTTGTGTTAIPNDDTIPQITEGVEYLTLAITPTSSSNKLIVEWVIGLHASGGTTGIVEYSCIFNTDIHSSNALACVGLQNPIGNNQNTSAGRYYVTAPGTSATTFRLRAGNSTTETYTFNGAAGSSRLSTACVSSITITEIAV